jgi:hypothetical protein
LPQGCEACWIFHRPAGGCGPDHRSAPVLPAGLRSPRLSRIPAAAFPRQGPHQQRGRRSTGPV